MKKQILIGSSVLGICLTGWVLFKKGPAQDQTTGRGQVPLAQAQKQTNLETKDLLSQTTSASAQAMVASQAQSTASTENTKTLQAQPIDQNVTASLSNYHFLNEKTFLTKAEEAEKKKILKDPQALKMAGSLLKNAAYMRDPQFEENQNRAIDLLLEAMTSGDQALATQEISALIQDSQVESSELPQDVRETLAGIKAELLYHATAMDPLSFAQIEKQLPGAVSQKIWKNVQEKQQENFEESMQEMKSQQSQAHNK